MQTEKKKKYIKFKSSASISRLKMYRNAGDTYSVDRECMQV